MKILFKQNNTKGYIASHLSDLIGIEGALMKFISPEEDRSHITRKRHYHSSVEIHIIEHGCQIYEIDSERVRVYGGQYLMILPNVHHVAVSEEDGTHKYAICFGAKRGSKTERLIGESPKYLTGDIPSQIRDNIRRIAEEGSNKDAYHSLIISERVFESILYFLRVLGLREESDEIADTDKSEDGRVLLAKQYISDNVCRSISLLELASYCYISEKQLSRIFLRAEGITVSAYIRKKRCERIEHLLSNTQMSLREISEAMGFDNEYYFNAFYKKYAGMSPGAYRRSASSKS